MPITLESHGKFRSNFSKLYILTLLCKTMMRLSISLAGHDQFMKTLMSLEPHGIFSFLNFVVF